MGFSEVKAAAYAACSTYFQPRITAGVPVAKADGWDDLSSVIATAVVGSSPGYPVIVRQLSDFPAASSGVITLPAGSAWIVGPEIDLQGARIVCAGTVCIHGVSSETSAIYSTGLSPDLPLIYSQYTLDMVRLSVWHDRAVRIEGDSNVALDWKALNFIGCSEYSAHITGCSSFIYNDSLLSESGPLLLDGNQLTIGLTNNLLIPAENKTALEVTSTASVSARIRVAFTSVLCTAAGSVGISVHPDALPAPERFLMTQVNFAGGGTYLGGVQPSDVGARFDACTGILNTASAASVYMQSNASTTTISDTGVYYQAVGIALAGQFVRQFTLDGSTTGVEYVGGLSAPFIVDVRASMQASNNNQIYLGVGVNGTLVPGSAIVSTSSGGLLSNRSENVSTAIAVYLSPGDVVMPMVRNASATGSMLVVDMVMAIQRLPG